MQRGRRSPATILRQLLLVSRTPLFSDNKNCAPKKLYAANPLPLFEDENDGKTKTEWKKRRQTTADELKPPTTNTNTNQQFSMLTDTFNRHHDYLRISLTERCNLRCLYCMPEDGIDLAPKDDLLTTEEIERLVKLFAKEGGVRKVRLTGGEPTVRKDLTDIVERISRIDGIEHVAMTTNGVALKSKLDALKRNGLKSINVSLDSLVKAKFEFMTRRDGLEKVLKSIDEAIRIGIETVKVNVVVVRG